ncbi:hypothetical protein QFZ98_007720 [Paraburkholderia youngii]
MLTQAGVSARSVEPNGASAGVAGARCAHIVPVILAGGSGTRLWPVSRENFPKQLIDVVGSDSLLQATARRLEGFPAGLERRRIADRRVRRGASLRDRRTVA